MTYTASFAFFEALWEAGIKYCFVNLGSDHPSLVEAFLKGKKERAPDAFPLLITCPNEMVALSMADGYARWSGKPQCVIVHVDVGTQGLGAAVHDASMGRAPVLIFAGLSPVTLEGEYRGSRSEYIHWIQDVPAQSQIVSQYCRYTAEIKTGRNIKQMVNRALSFATSQPQGPVYLSGAREVMEEEIPEYKLNQSYWKPVEPSALPESAVRTISDHLARAVEPLIITGYSGRNHAAVEQLVKLADAIPNLRVLDTGGSDMCFPARHPAWLGLRYGSDSSIQTADIILVIDADVPWIPTQCKPKHDAVIFHIDVDPLKQQMPTFYIDAVARYKADSCTALSQLVSQLSGVVIAERDAKAKKRLELYEAKLDTIQSLAVPAQDGTYGPSYLAARLRDLCPSDTIWVIEAVTTTGFVADQLQAHLPGSWINCGGGGLGWSGGAALGVKLATTAERSPDATPRFVCQIVGDGTFLFSVPSSVYWISRRYNLPVLTIVLNNKGWNAPKRSALLVHPDGLASRSTNEELNISFDPSPDYAGIAKASAGGKLWADRATTAEQLERLLPAAIESVVGGVGAVLDAHLEGGTGKYVVGVEASSG